MILVIVMIFGTAIYVGSHAVPRIMHEKESGESHDIAFDTVQADLERFYEITKIQNIQKQPF